jgi:hypothetical protein
MGHAEHGCVEGRRLGAQSLTRLHAFLDDAELVVGAALEEDPHLGIANAADSFDALRQIVSQRVASVRMQALANSPAPRG